MHVFLKYGIFTAFTGIILCFDIIWNVPSHRCLSEYGIDLNLSKYDIISNKEEEFEGQKINIFYETKPGLYPKFLANGTEVNGGIPQNASFFHHFVKAKSDIENTIPYSDFSGYAVIDWESWRPIFERNRYEEEKHIYIKKSLELVKNQHPTWSSQKVFREAKRQFESSAEWERKGDGRSGLQEGTKRASGACSGDTKLRHLRIQGKFEKGTMQAFAYTTFKYTDTKVYYSKNDVINTISQSMDAGLDGNVVWLSSSDVSSRDDCQSLHKYIQEIFGPMSKFVINFARICSAVLCNNHGKCVRANWLKQPKLQFGRSDKMLDLSDYKCKCNMNWSGKHCQNI
ncbi:hypothetical protein FSP39_010534 [Pinctada imbricata]|uniref:Hyaluronidase n=1 Tax=Pinctada imbricata TaxID=66713 RepID=A0AA88XL29_PINIB|nr:hypothetical protein FSP39_010534 [Pinctada imbricata]